MPAILSEHEQWFDSVTGEPIVNGYVYIGIRSLDPVANPQNIYSDRALTTELANPQRTDADGRTVNKIWVADRYSIKVTDSAGSQKYLSLDNGHNADAVGITADDTDPGYLSDKITVSDNIIKTIINPGGNETLNLETTDKTYNTVSDLLAGAQSGTFTLYGYHEKGDTEPRSGYFNPTLDQSNHNGGTILGKDKVFPTDWTNQTQVAAWFTAGTGLGCWVLPYNTLSVADFGAVGIGLTKPTIAMQAAINSLSVGEILTFPDKYLISSKLIVSTYGVNFVGNTHYLGSLHSTIEMDSSATDDEMFDLQIDGVVFWGLNLKGKGKGVSGSHIATTARADNVADIDVEFRDCVLSNFETFITLTGRGINVFNCTITTWIHGIIFDWASSLTEGGFVDQKQSTGFRTIRFQHNRVHAGSSSYLFFNTNTNHENIWGVQITDNYIDTTCGIWRGTLKDAVITGNKHFNNTTTPFLVQTGFTMENVVTTGNEFNGMPDDGYGNTKEYPVVIYADIVKNLTFTSNLVKRCESDCFQFVSASSSYINISSNIFEDVLIEHRNPTQRYIVKLAASGIVGLTFNDNIITPSPEAEAALVAGDELVNSPGSAPNYNVSNNQYTGTWKLSSITPTAGKRNGIANQVYIGDGTVEQVIDLDFYPTAVIVHTLDGATVGAMHMQVYGTSTGATNVELRNGSVAVKLAFNTNTVKYNLIAFP